MAYIMNLNEQTLLNFIITFYGSGNYSGDYWFVGMEEGGGKDLDQVSTRINTWQRLGETELVDIYDFHLRINYPEYFTNPVKLQRTWMQEARIVLAAKGLPCKTEDVRKYQRDVIGRKDKETCLLELLPLPSPSTSVWHYNERTALPILKNRQRYEDHCLPWRIEHIRSKILEHQPKLVVFCGSSYLQHWKAIAGNQVVFQKLNDFWAAKEGKTLYLIVKHPALKGITNAYFEEVGDFARATI